MPKTAAIYGNEQISKWQLNLSDGLATVKRWTEKSEWAIVKSFLSSFAQKTGQDRSWMHGYPLFFSHKFQVGQLFSSTFAR